MHKTFVPGCQTNPKGEDHRKHGGHVTLNTYAMQNVLIAPHPQFEEYGYRGPSSQIQMASRALRREPGATDECVWGSHAILTLIGRRRLGVVVTIVALIQTA